MMATLILLFVSPFSTFCLLDCPPFQAAAENHAVVAVVVAAAEAEETKGKVVVEAAAVVDTKVDPHGVGVVVDPHGVVVAVATEEAVLDAEDQDAVMPHRTTLVSIASSPTFFPANLPRRFRFISTRSIAPTRTKI